jgi:hypothetical protein
MPRPAEAGPESPILVVFVNKGGNGGGFSSDGGGGGGDGGGGDGGGGGGAGSPGGGGSGAEMKTHTPAAPEVTKVTATVAHSTSDAYVNAFPALGGAKPAVAVDDSARDRVKALERRLATEAMRYSQLQSSVAEELIAQRESGDRRVREVQALAGERIARLEAEVAQMRSRCVLLDELAGKMAALGLLPMANHDVAAGSNTTTDESKAKDARIAELERAVEAQGARDAQLRAQLAKQALAFERMQARALQAEMKNP